MYNFLCLRSGSSYCRHRSPQPCTQAPYKRALDPGHTCTQAVRLSPGPCNAALAGEAPVVDSFAGSDLLPAVGWLPAVEAGAGSVGFPPEAGAAGAGFPLMLAPGGAGLLLTLASAGAGLPLVLAVAGAGLLLEFAVAEAGFPLMSVFSGHVSFFSTPDRTVSVVGG